MLWVILGRENLGPGIHVDVGQVNSGVIVDCIVVQGANSKIGFILLNKTKMQCKYEEK